MTKNKFATKSCARLAAIQALYQQEITDLSPQEISQSFRAYDLLSKQNLGVAKPDATLFKKLLKGTQENLADIDQLLQGVLPSDWSFERLELLIRLTLETAIFELLFMPKTHAHIIISEYVDVAAAFYNEKEVTFINGLLNAVARKIRPEDFTE